MCFPSDAVPPIPRIHGASVDHESLTLTSSDGNELMAFHATGDAPDGPAVVILPDIRGLYRFYEELALRFAERGYDALAIDYFGRTAGHGARDDDFEFRPHVDATTHEGLLADVEAAATRLRTSAPDRPIFTVGFCFGGSGSWHQAANGLGLAGAVGFYGNPTRSGVPIGSDAVVDRVGDITCPILGLMAGDDPGIPAASVDQFQSALDTAGVSNELVTYPGAPHSFFDRSYDVFESQSADAWNRVLAFMAATAAAG